MKSGILLNLVIAVMLMNCSNPIQPDQNTKYSFVFTEGFNQSRTILKFNNIILMDSLITSTIQAPNSGSSFWNAAETNTLIKKGTYELNIKIENIEKDTTITLTDSLYNYIAFFRDSSKIEIVSKNHPNIYM